MWLAIVWGGVLTGFALALCWAYNRGQDHGIAQESEETYEAAKDARELARRIRNRAKRLYRESKG